MTPGDKKQLGMALLVLGTMLGVAVYLGVFAR